MEWWGSAACSTLLSVSAQIFPQLQAPSNEDTGLMPRSIKGAWQPRRVCLSGRVRSWSHLPMDTRETGRRRSLSGFDFFLLIGTFVHLIKSSQIHPQVLTNHITPEPKRPSSLMTRLSWQVSLPHFASPWAFSCTTPGLKRHYLIMSFFC